MELADDEISLMAWLRQEEMPVDGREALARASIFAQLTPDLLDSLACSATMRRFAPGDVLARERWPATACFVICCGQAEVIKGLGSENEQVIRTLAEGDCFGKEALLDGFCRAASVRATTDVQCLVLARWDFRDLTKANPEIALDIFAAPDGFREAREAPLSAETLA